MKKVLYIFAGVNGAGKSTLYNSENLDNEIKYSTRINTDEIVYSFGDWKSNIDQIKAGKIAFQLLFFQLCEFLSILLNDFRFRVILFLNLFLELFLKLKNQLLLFL